MSGYQWWPANAGTVHITRMSNRHLFMAITHVQRRVDAKCAYYDHLQRVGTRKATRQVRDDVDFLHDKRWLKSLQGELSRREQQRVFISDEDAERLRANWDYDPFSDGDGRY